MSRGASVCHRTGRLETRVQETTVRAAVARVAAATGADPGELLAAALALLERARGAGARTAAAVDTFALRELGMTEEELRAEVARRGAGR
jgi:hypothetical protein